NIAIHHKQLANIQRRTILYMQYYPSCLTYKQALTHIDKKTPDGNQGISYQAYYELIAFNSKISVGVFCDIIDCINSGVLPFCYKMIM
ncbi:hypothetical protein AIZ14_25930, partial [Salmonella enterica subsp. enterica serovar Typhimurium]